MFDIIQVRGLFEMCVVPMRVDSLYFFVDDYILRKALFKNTYQTV